MSSLESICSETKQARELSLTGQYEDALTYYQSVLQQIKRHISGLTNLDTKKRWQEVNGARNTKPAVCSDAAKIGQKYFHVLSSCVRRC